MFVCLILFVCFCFLFFVFILYFIKRKTYFFVFVCWFDFVCLFLCLFLCLFYFLLKEKKSFFAVLNTIFLHNVRCFVICFRRRDNLTKASQIKTLFRVNILAHV